MIAAVKGSMENLDQSWERGERVWLGQPISKVHFKGLLLAEYAYEKERRRLHQVFWCADLHPLRQGGLSVEPVRGKETSEVQGVKCPN